MILDLFGTTAECPNENASKWFLLNNQRNCCNLKTMQHTIEEFSAQIKVQCKL